MVGKVGFKKKKICLWASLFCFLLGGIRVEAAEKNLLELKYTPFHDTVIYVTPHLVPKIPLFARGAWQKVTVPEIFVEKGAHFEIWDGGNRPIAGYKGQQLLSREIDLFIIPFSHKSAIRLVIFPQSLSVERSDVEFQFEILPDRRLQGILVMVFFLFLLLVVVSIVKKCFPRVVLKFLPVMLGTGSEKPSLFLISALWIVIVFSGIYGLTLGLFGGGIQVLYTFIKFPLFLLGTAGISFMTWHLINLVMGSDRSLADSAIATVRALATQSVLLASFAPILAYFIGTRVGHDRLLLLHVVLFGSSLLLHFLVILWGNGAELLRGRQNIAVFFWVGLVVFVGGQLAWLLRPWVGTFEYTGQWIPFMRLYSGNVWEQLFRTVLRL